MIKFILNSCIVFFITSITFAQNVVYDTLQETKEYLLYFNHSDTSMNFYDKKIQYSYKEKKRLWSIGWMGTYDPKPYLASLEYKDDSVMIFSFTDYYENTFTYVSRYYYLYNGKEFQYIPLSDHQPEKYDYLISLGIAQPFDEKVIFKRTKNTFKINIRIQVYSEDMKRKQTIVKKYVLDTKWNGKLYFKRTFLKHLSSFWIG